MRLHPLLGCVGVLALLASFSRHTAAGDGPWDLDDLAKPPKYRWVDETSPIRSLIYKSEPMDGEPTEVFAFYATPGTLKGDPSHDHDLPAVVLIHGGGGTAFAQWVEIWARRGYAAIAMDLSGRRPAAPQFNSETRALIVPPDYHKIPRSRLEKGGPEQGHPQKFDSVGGEISDDWPYHAVASAIRAHSLIRSFPEVDADRTAVTGISWGGYLTCIVGSLDNRFKAAVPVYGCGFLYEGESVQKPAIDKLSPEKRKLWIEMYDPSAHLGKCEVPILFVNGTNDIHYPLNSYRRSYDLVPSDRHLRIEVGMRHSHPAGWEPEEIGLFVDQYLRDGVPLPEVSRPVVNGRTATMQVESATPIKLAQFHYTSDDGLLSKRKWQSREVKLSDSGEITVEIPEEARVWLVTVTDDRDALVSSDVMFPKGKP